MTIYGSGEIDNYYNGWSSYAETITKLVTVNSKGKVTFLKKGTVKITIKAAATTKYYFTKKT